MALSPFSHETQFSWTSSKLSFSKQPEAQSYFKSRVLNFNHGNTGFTRKQAQTPHSRLTPNCVTAYIFWTTRHTCLLRQVVWNYFAFLLWPKDASDRNKVPWPPLLKSWYIVRFVKYSTWVSIMWVFVLQRTSARSVRSVLQWNRHSRSTCWHTQRWDSRIWIKLAHVYHGPCNNSVNIVTRQWFWMIHSLGFGRGKRFFS